ncbi:hypothetical protein SNE40_021947 [Patella caerulea]|uniref:Fibrinogen C-terminal domain-containing protein n=1 Tax=Patella caerulea TaxID=87958 RepID=A0AAN8G0M3_PATCE
MLSLIITAAIFITPSHTFNHPFSSFSRSSIIQNTCDDHKVLSRTTVRGKFDCGAACGQDADCQRYLYCANNARCMLYLDGTDCIMNGDSTGCYCYSKAFGYTGTSITCPLGYYGNNCEFLYKDCHEAWENGVNIDGKFALMTIQPNASSKPFEVTCLLEYDGGSTVILFRTSICKHENFNRTMAEYEHGFGSVPLNRWIGLTKLRAIINYRTPDFEFRLHVLLFNTAWLPCSSFYLGFEVDNKLSKYSLDIAYKGDIPCGDSLTDLVGNPFSTYDSDHTGSNKCAQRFGGGWWFGNTPNCTKSFLTGTMDGSRVDNFWLDNLSGECLKKSVVFLMPYPN